MAKHNFAPSLKKGSVERSLPRFRGGVSHTEGSRSLVGDRRFRWAWCISIALHISMFAVAAWSPSSANYRFYGSGTAVSLVGADEIPGGSARGKSGDRPEEFQFSPKSDGQKLKKIGPEPKRKNSKTKIKKRNKSVRKKRRKKRRKLVREKKNKLVKKIFVKKKKRKKKISKRRLANLRKLKRRRDRLKRWRKRQKKKNRSLSATKRARPSPDLATLSRGELHAHNVIGGRPKPRSGYLGEGGGDGQGGGSLGGGSGGVARNDIERYYGLLAHRVKRNWSVPKNLAKIKSLKTEIIFDVSRKGRIRKLRIEKSSGSRVYDDAVLRAVARSANPFFPPPPTTMKKEWLPLGFRFCGQTFCR